MIDPIQLLIKTTANYIAFKTVKTSVDYCTNRPENINQFLKAAECPVCMNVWSNCPSTCPHCNYSVLKKLYRDYEYRKEEDGMDFEINSSLTVRR